MREELDALMSGLPDTKPGKLFGMDGFKVGRKVFATWSDARLVLKLPAGEIEAALAVDGATSYEPMPGRPMKDWIALPVDTDDELRRLIDASHAYVSKLAKE